MGHPRGHPFILLAAVSDALHAILVRVKLNKNYLVFQGIKLKS